MNTGRKLFAAGILAVTLTAAYAQTATGTATAPAAAGTTTDLSGQTIAQVVTSDPRFSTLLRALQAAGLAETLGGSAVFTVFAPTNDAFAKIPADQLNALLANRAQLRAVLLNHVVSGRLPAADAVSAGRAITLNGGGLTVRSMGGSVMAGPATVIGADLTVSNGIIHVIDTVLLP